MSAQKKDATPSQNSKKTSASSKPLTGSPSPVLKLFDPVAFSGAMIKTYEKAQPIFEKMMEQYSEALGKTNPDPMNISEAYSVFMENMLAHPDKFWERQTDFMEKWLTLVKESQRKLVGEKSHPVIEPDRGDRRFRDPEWNENTVFDFIKQSYLLTSKWIQETVENTDGLTRAQKEKLSLATRLLCDACAPSNFVMTNPEVLKETLHTGGQNLIKGFENLIKDLERGQGELKISTTDYSAFELGRNVASTPGKIIYQNDLMQLIQYEASTDKVFKTPLLIIPPWINKYYILDMRPENSFIKWAVEQGHTVFVISWVNPDKSQASKGFSDYMDDGVIAALDQIKKVTGEEKSNVIGYCLGGTLLTITLSYLHAKKQSDRIQSATFLTTLIDFENSGELKLFVDDLQLQIIEKELSEKGVFEGKQLKQTFSILRANDLIWSFVINNYLMGKEPFPFDLLYWNDDSTNLPAAMQRFYLRNMYRDNLLVKPDGITVKNCPIDIHTFKTPSYFLSTKEDHIAPWQATFSGMKHLQGSKVFVLAESGHIAGVINPPTKNKYGYWTNGNLEQDADDWIGQAKEHNGSWWEHWQSWVEKFNKTKVSKRDIKESIEAAPGSYVRVRIE